MWVVIILIIVAVVIISVAAANSASKKEAELNKQREYEAQQSPYQPRQTTTTTQTYQQNDYSLTEADKQQLANSADPQILTTAINAYSLALNGDSEGMAYLGEGIYHSYLNNPTKAIYWLQRA